MFSQNLAPEAFVTKLDFDGILADFDVSKIYADRYKKVDFVKDILHRNDRAFCVLMKALSDTEQKHLSIKKFE